jgi:predicted short-subunit dehydrogenase-like oxidoreductase (DUF2520 family)
MTTPTLGFIGAGTTGTALALALSKAGYRVTAVASRTPSHAQALADRLPHASMSRTPRDVAARCDLIFLTVPDDAVASVAGSVAWRAGQSVVHCSGVHSLEPLYHAQVAGAEVGAFHPLQTLANAKRVDALRGVSFAIEASTQRLHDVLAQMAKALGGTTAQIRGADKPLYHASAAMASNYLVTLLDAASEVWRSIGSTRAAGLQALLPLVRGTIDNLEALGFPDALTGPIARGDVETVGIHLRVLRESQPQLVALYIGMGKKTIDLALEKGGISAESAAAMHALFDAATLKESA